MASGEGSMNGQTPISLAQIAISIPESSDIGIIGLGNGHLRDAAADIATHILASGYNIAYGGDLRDKGFTQLLFELIARYTPIHEPEETGKDKYPKAHQRIINYLAWPVHIRMNIDEINHTQRPLVTSENVYYLIRKGRK